MVDITEADIGSLVPAFYEHLRQDAVLGPIFDEAIDDWPRHLETLKAFWSSVMLTSRRYKGQPMVAHFRHEQVMTAENFARWLDLWRDVSDRILPREKAAVFQEKAQRIAESLQLGIRFQRERHAA